MKKKESMEINDSDFEEVKSEEVEVTKKYSEKQFDALRSFATILAEILVPSLSKGLFDFLPSNEKKERKQTMEEKKVDLVKSLLESGIDLAIFDSLITNEINRRLKTRFGITFLIFTFIVTIASYMIVVFDAIYKWGISQVAITALIIEIPIQFIGLYIIAKNLFPVSIDRK